MFSLRPCTHSSSGVEEKPINLSIGNDNILSETQVKLYFSSLSKGHGHRQGSTRTQVFSFVAQHVSDFSLDVEKSGRFVSFQIKHNRSVVEGRSEVLLEADVHK